MLTLYHHGSSVCVAKVRIYLHEKGIDWEGEYVDILKGDQFDPAYLKLNPKAVVPALVHDGTVITESTVICEYIETVFPDRPIRPADPVACAHVMYWRKSIDEDLHPACAALTFMASHRHTINRLGLKELQKKLNSTPPFSVSHDCHEKKKVCVRQAFDTPDGSQRVRVYDDYVLKMEKTLANGKWLVGDYFSFADDALSNQARHDANVRNVGEWAKATRH